MTSPLDSVQARPARRWRTALLLVAAWSVPAVISAGQSYLGSVGERLSVSFGRYLIIQLPLWWFWALATPFIVWLLDRWPLERGRLRVSVPVHVVAMLLTAVVHTGLIASYTKALYPPPAGEPSSPVFLWFTNYLRSRLQFELLTYVLVLMTVLGLRWLRQARERELAASRLQAQLSQAELLALKMQLHPHFLFNTLHAIGVLVRENPAAAERTITLLGDLLRATLTHAGVQEVTLAEELGFLRTYLEIEQLRFQDRLTVHFEVEPGNDRVLVPNFILQPLVENAVRHGIEPREEAGSIIVRVRRHEGDIELAVLDDGHGITTVSRREGNGIGLSTTRSRLAMLYGAGGALALSPRPEGGLACVVRIPRKEAA
jgi:two-component system, LytTR family, sensor kinase